MSRADPQFNLRLPKALRKKIEEAAAERKRSLTQEIVERLELTFKTFDEVQEIRSFAEGYGVGVLQALVANAPPEVAQYVNEFASDLITFLEGRDTARRRGAKQPRDRVRKNRKAVQNPQAARS